MCRSHSDTRAGLGDYPNRKGGPIFSHLISRARRSWRSVRQLVDFARWNTVFHQGQTRFLVWFKEGSGYIPVILFRKYSTFSLVVSSALLVSATNYGQEVGGLERLSASLNVNLPSENRVVLRRAAQESQQHNLSLVSLAAPLLAADMSVQTETNVLDEAYLSPENQMFIAQAVGANSARDPEEDGGVKIYTVAAGDTVSGIAAVHGVTVNTILWANDLDNVDSIRPGDQIFILPVAGFNYTVKSEDTIDSIAAKYKADRSRIIAYNGLPANGDLTAGTELIIPDGVKESAPAAPVTTGLARREYASQTGRSRQISLRVLRGRVKGRLVRGIVFHMVIAPGMSLRSDMSRGVAMRVPGSIMRVPRATKLEKHRRWVRLL